jgi:hypothetical protein
MNRHILIAGAALMLCGSVLVAEQRGITRVNPPPGGVRFAEPFQPKTGGATRVIGTVIDIRQTPVAYAKVQLRDLSTGAVLSDSTTDANGEYAFDLDLPGTYVVEMVMVDGYVVALSNAGSLARYETLNTVVILPGRWDALLQKVTMPQQPGAYLGVGAQTTMTAATMQLAADQQVRPIEAGEPVSAHTP